jgi:hypothetical protein
MPLFWIVHLVEDKPVVFIQEAAGMEIARLKAAVAGFKGGAFSAIHELDEKTARKIPKKMIGRGLSQREATALLKRIG